MSPSLYLWAVPAAAALLAGASYWVGKAVQRRKLLKALRATRPWQEPTIKRWVTSGWLAPELMDTVPAHLTPAQLFSEWAWLDPESVSLWRLPAPLLPDTPLEAMVAQVWDALPSERRELALDRLRSGAKEAAVWWGGAERGWNRRPLLVLQAALGKKSAGLPLLGVEDLTGAPIAGPFQTDRLLADADGPELILALAAMRSATPRFMHPLAPKQGKGTSLVAGLSTRVASDVGRRVGAGLGAALGPIGSLVGQYLGEMAGRMGGEALAKQSLAAEVSEALEHTESALSNLGKLAETDDFSRAARGAAETVKEQAMRLDAAIQDRRGIAERLWPTPGRLLAEEVRATTAADMERYSTAAESFVAIARKGPPAVAGGMVLQNPWLVRKLPGGVEKLNAARQALNAAARELHRQPVGKP